ncbi:craniofacial development protein 2-like [Acanthaster planci]|uniref:Craniofacial development protein 2-like n=1 Tax=Acanthaster planci TaxID=133434 RepID=A0A8B7ZXF1_ACAPL|nr:craniofacial development protein 2-like [Acanthaster planci]
MANLVTTNPILPVPGVDRSCAADSGVGQCSTRQYDSAPPTPDDSIKPKAILRCKRPFIVATFNANTVREEGRLREMDHCAVKCGVEILGVHEHGRVHSDTIVFEREEGSYFITSSAWRNAAQAANGGVGLLLSPRARRSLRSVRSHSERILVAEFDSNPVTTVLVAYSPTNLSQVKDVELIYEQLTAAVRSMPALNVVAILVDFNSRLGSDNVPYTCHYTTRRNGTLMYGFMTEHQLLAADTEFQRKYGNRLIFRDNGTGIIRQFDYILVRRKWRNSILNAEPFSSFASVGSDHRVVSMKVSLSLRVK